MIKFYTKRLQDLSGEEFKQLGKLTRRQGMMKRWLDRSRRSTLNLWTVIVKDKSVALGWVLVILRTWKYRKQVRADQVMIHVYVTPKLRGKGLATHLVKRAEKLIRKSIPGVKIVATPSDTAGKALFESLDYDEVNYLSMTKVQA